ncbi:MAG: DUF2813 domain-containing protein [Ruminococcus sp.]|nr:DUF2813 domain-containing protein [Ruminococcus sp.]
MSINHGKLSKIVIKGYKSIKNCSLDLNNVNVLIGSNGAGKSNFISSFSLLQNILNKNLQLSVQQSGLNSMFYNGRKETEEIFFEAQFNNNSYGFCLIPTDDNRIIFKKEFYSFNGCETLVCSAHDESKWENNLSDEIDNHVKPILKKQNWRVYHFHDTSRTAKVKQEHNISNSKSLMFDASNLAAFLYRLKNNFHKNYDEIVETIRLIAPYFDDFMLEPQDGNKEHIILKWHQRGCEDVFNASQLSDGTLRFICLATLLLQPDNLQPETIIIDEPELGLHPYAIIIFSEMVKQISAKKQIIISTQSVELLNEFNVEDVIVVNKDTDGASCFERLNKTELETWLDDYSLGDLWQKNILGAIGNIKNFNINPKINTGG